MLENIPLIDWEGDMYQISTTWFFSNLFQEKYAYNVIKYGFAILRFDSIPEGNYSRLYLHNESFSYAFFVYILHLAIVNKVN